MANARENSWSCLRLEEWLGWWRTTMPRADKYIQTPSLWERESVKAPGSSAHRKLSRNALASTNGLVPRLSGEPEAILKGSCGNLGRLLGNDASLNRRTPLLLWQWRSWLRGA